jgi:hypothetical protein
MSAGDAPLRRVSGEREGPAPKAWEGEVAYFQLRRRGATHLTPTLSPRKRAERESLAIAKCPRCRHKGSYKLASFELRRSVISILPGAWVMQKSGLAWVITACGVTPHAQNTGSSSLFTGTASP